MQEPNPSAKRPSGWRRSKFVAGTLALTMGVLGAGLAATALPASASATSNQYSIGSLTGSVTNVTISPTSTTANASESEELFFTATAALTSTDTITVTSDETLGAAPTGVQVIDSSGPCLENASASALVAYSATETFVITLNASCTIAVGNTVGIDFTYTPTVTGTTTFTVATTTNGTPSSAADLTVNGQPPTLSASSLTTGYNAVYTIGDLGASGATGGSWASLTGTATPFLELTAAAPIATNFSFYYGEAGYTVTVTPSGGSATTDAITSFSATQASPGPYTNVFLGLTTAIPSGATVTVTAEGTNGSSATVGTNEQKFSITPESAANIADEVGNTETTNDITFGSSVTGVSVVPSPTLAGASSNYSIAFTAGTTGTPADICISEGSDGTVFTSVSGALVTDTTGGWQYVPSTILEAALPTGNPGCGGTGYGIVLELAGQKISAGDAVTVLLAGVTNPAAQTVSDFTVADSQDSLNSTGAPYAITVSESAGISVTASPATVGSLSTYTISNIVVSSAGVAAGTTIGLDTTTDPQADTVFPNNNLDYVVTDTTTKAGSGTATAVAYVAGATDDVTITVPNALLAGDIVSITVEDIINPTTSGDYAITVAGNLGAPTVVAPAFPNASVTYPDGAIVNFGGTYYLFAGGHPFGIPTLAVLTSIQVIDHAVVLTAATGATPPVTSPLLGTTIIVYNNPTIYVVGTSGLNGFSTPAQFLSDGYDPADVITVPNFGGLSVGATVGSVGTGDNVIGTAANGAIIDSSGTFYVVAGGRACGIATPAQLSGVQAGDQATPLVGAVPSSWTTSIMENGTVVTVNSVVFVADGGDLFELKSPTQLAADGLGGTPSIVLGNYCGMPVVTSYTGS
jgi:hypothetical protein